MSPDVTSGPPPVARCAAAKLSWRAAGYWSRHHALVGALAALVAAALMLWMNQRWGGTLFTQLVVDRLTIVLPLSFVRQALADLEADAKPVMLIGLTLAQMVFGGLLGAIFGRVARRDLRSRAVGCGALVLVYWLAWSLSAALLGGSGWFVIAAPGGFWPTQAALAVGALGFGVLTALCVPWPNARRSEASDRAAVPNARRRALVLTGMRAAVLCVPAVASAGYLGRFALRLRHARQPAQGATASEVGDAFAMADMPSRITQVSAFYIVSKNILDPTVDIDGWHLELGGLVERPLQLSYTDVLARAVVEFPSTLTCISNTIGGEYMSTAIWGGVLLRDLLADARLLPNVIDIELHAADGYVESLSLEQALAGDTLVVHTINGERLPDEHGFPLRLLVPGRYGIKNVKWLTSIAAVGEDVRGYWQARGWSETAEVVTTSRIDTPHRGRRLPLGQPARIGGIAFAGTRGISLVELSLDDGVTWQAVDLDEQLSPRTWRRWKHEYQPSATGVVKLAVRAADGAGTPQIASARDPLPEGATGYHRTWFEIVPAEA